MIFDTEKILNEFSGRTAYSAGGKTFTYRELFERAKEISGEISAEECSAAAIIGSRNFETMAAITACVISGCAYIPVDISLPEERRKSIIESSGASVLMDCTGGKTVLRKIKHPEENGGKNKTAYIIFTSGSTGKPKGVPISYSNLENFIRWINALEPLREFEHAAVLNHASFGFDLSTAAIYYALTNGHALVQYENNGDFANLFSVIEENKTDIIVATPTFLRLCMLSRDFNAENFPFIKCIYFCGETLQKSLAKAVFERFPEIRIINAYGPTEATSAVCAIEITKEILEHEEILPVGKISSAAAEIVIEDGEIVLKGESVFKGYLGGMSGGYYSENGIDCYRTGDIGFIKNGKLYFRGRKDSQIKFKGYRIELSDIEANLSEISGIENCAVIAKRNPEGEVRFLKAFVSGNVPEEKIRTELLKKLPDYMIPKNIRVLESLPMNKNGKTDRKELMNL